MVVKVLKMRFTDKSDTPVLFTIANPKRGITPSALKSGFLPAAKPVLGVVTLDEAYYLTTNKESLKV